MSASHLLVKTRRKPSPLQARVSQRAGKEPSVVAPGRCRSTPVGVIRSARISWLRSAPSSDLVVWCDVAAVGDAATCRSDPTRRRPNLSAPTRVGRPQRRRSARSWRRRCARPRRRRRPDGYDRPNARWTRPPGRLQSSAIDGEPDPPSRARRLLRRDEAARRPRHRRDYRFSIWVRERRSRFGSVRVSDV